MDNSVVQGWIDFLNSTPYSKSKVYTAGINKVSLPITYKKYIESLERKQLARIDFESVLTNRHKFNIVYTDSDTYISKDPTYKPIKEEEGIFQW